MSSRKPPHVNEEPMTYEDYASMPDDGYRYELVDHRLEVMSPAPSTVHQLFVGSMRDALNDKCRSQYLLIPSPVDVIFSERDVRQPDLVAVHRNRMDIVKIRGIFGTPDLVVEVVSPGSFQRDRRDKLVTYAQYGVPEYWLADPVNGTLEQYVYSGDELVLTHVYEGDDQVQSEQIPCARFTLADIMKEIPEIDN